MTQPVMLNQVAKLCLDFLLTNNLAKYHSVGQN
jgi:hypothetical protein